MIQIPQEDQRIARRELRRQRLLILRPPLRPPEMRAWNRDGRAILFRRLRQRCHAADHHGELRSMGVVVT